MAEAAPEAASGEAPGIGTLNEKSLHAALKAWYAEPGDRFEVAVDGYVIDIVRGDLLVEIQTRNFTAIRRKLVALTASHRVRLVYPVAQEKWIVRVAQDGGGRLSRRKSPKRGTAAQIFDELVRIPQLLAAANFSIDVVLIREEEIRRYDAKRGWRRKGWVTHERRLLEVVDRQRFVTPTDLCTLLPDALAGPFTTADLAAAMGAPRRLAQRMAYCLRALDAITPVGKRGHAILYERSAR
ncbi:MAG: hypothetical protein Kow00120_00230 [Anaerolineae bacterium]